MQESLLDHPSDPSLMGLSEGEPLGDAGLNRLRWRCRRGLLENDLFIQKFFQRHGNNLTVGNARAMYEIMRLTDNDLLDILLGRTTKSVHDLINNHKELDNETNAEKTEKPEIQKVIKLLKG
jgi:antitoxin CptB